MELNIDTTNIIQEIDTIYLNNLLKGCEKYNMNTDYQVYYPKIREQRLKDKLDCRGEKHFNCRKVNQYAQNQNIRRISDRTLIEQFKNEVDVPGWILDSRINQIFNDFLAVISKITKAVI